MYKTWNKYNRNITFQKSQYNLANQFILQSYLNRIDKNNYDVVIVETKKVYKIIVTPKIKGA